jgi:hypothetical protein
LQFRAGLWYVTTSSASTVVAATDIGSDDLNARDWTDEPPGADPCGATPAYNTVPLVYGQWSDAPVQLPPPVPAFT